MHMKISAKWRFMSWAAFGFQLRGSLCAGEKKKKMIEDGLPRLGVFFFFHASDSSKCTCLSKLSLWGLGGKNQGGRNNEGSQCLREISTPTEGFSSLNSLHHHHLHHHHHVCSFWKQHPDNSNPPSSDHCLLLTVKSRLWSKPQGGSFRVKQRIERL